MVHDMLREDKFCSMKLVYYTQESDRTCSLRPTPFRVRGQAIRSAFYVLARQVGQEAQIFNYGRICASSGIIAMDYITYYFPPVVLGIAPRLDMHDLYPDHETLAMNSTVLRGDHINSSDDCYVFNSGMTSGERGTLGSDLHSGSRLVSPNGFYELVLESNCNLVLYAMKWKELWSTNTAGKGGGPGCILTLQRDGNLVLLGSDGHGIFSANVYCQPQP